MSDASSRVATGDGTDAPHSAEHRQRAPQAVVRSRGRCGEPREERDDTGSEHLRWGRTVRRLHRHHERILTMPNLRPILSERYPKMSMPTTVPANVKLDSVVL